MSTATISHDLSDIGSIIDVRPLQPTVGAEIHGVDISRPLTDAQRDAIKAAILAYKVVFFRDQTLDKQSHAAFARQFGPLYDYAVRNYGDYPRLLERILIADERLYADL